MNCEVIIVGAGPTGLTAALELARSGRHVRVLDAAAAPIAGARGNGIQPRTLEVLDPLGVTDRLVSLGTFDIPVRAYGPDRSFIDRERNLAAEPSPERPFTRPLIIPQWQTERVLRDRLAEFGVVVEQKSRVLDVTQNETAVTVRLSEGRGLSAPYLIGADGGSSSIRRAVDVSFLGDTDETMRMLLAEVELDGLDRDHWHQFDLSTENGSGFIALLPLPASPSWALQFQAPDPDAVPNDATLRAVTDGILPRVRLRNIGWSSTWRLNVRMVDRYRNGRVFLAGDAAHVHSPAGGQGLNTGVQDAVNLGWKLAAVLDGADANLLDTYEQERLPVAAHILGLSSEQTRQVADAGLRGFAERSASLQRQARQLDISYRADPDLPGLQPGDRAPDSILDGNSTLFIRRRGTPWTLVDFSDTPEPLGGIQVLNATTADSDGSLRRAYAPEPGERFLIRPDGHLGWRGTGTPPRPGSLASIGR